MRGNAQAPLSIMSPSSGNPAGSRGPRRMASDSSRWACPPQVKIWAIRYSSRSTVFKVARASSKGTGTIWLPLRAAM